MSKVTQHTRRLIAKHREHTHARRPVTIKTEQFAALVAESGTANAGLLAAAKSQNRPGGPLTICVNCCDLVELLDLANGSAGGEHEHDDQVEAAGSAAAGDDQVDDGDDDQVDDGDDDQVDDDEPADRSTEPPAPRLFNE